MAHMTRQETLIMQLLNRARTIGVVGASPRPERHSHTVARSRPMARQLVSQGHVQVNERRVTIPSYLVRQGEKIALTETAATFPAVSEELEQQHPTPSWLQRVDEDGRVLGLPSLNDVNLPVEARKVIAFYSR